LTSSLPMSTRWTMVRISSCLVCQSAVARPSLTLSGAHSRIYGREDRN